MTRLALLVLSSSAILVAACGGEDGSVAPGEGGGLVTGAAGSGASSGAAGAGASSGQGSAAGKGGSPGGSGSGGTGTAGFGAAGSGTAGSGTAGSGTAGAGGAGGKSGGSGGSAGSIDASTKGNPFAGAEMYVNPDYVKKLQDSIDASPDAKILEKVKPYATGIWLDRIAMVDKVDGYLDDALALQKKIGKPVVTVFVVYDLPNRDCHAKASNGELRIETGGAAKYQSAFIDPIAAAFAKHPDQRIVAIVEPDSLPNIATNLSDPACAAAETAYREGSAYAIKKLSAPNVFLYLDAGHSGWLGWPDNQTKSAQVFKQVLDAAGGPDKIRGFASNVANYTVLKETKELFDYQGNPCHDELTYAAALQKSYAAAGLTHTAWLIDTSRNGVGGIRHQWGYWCNNKGAGLGERPKADPAPGIDAYYWVKPPGESDGTSDPSAARYDAFCGMEDAAKPAPEAGAWFSSYVVDAAKNAKPALLRSRLAHVGGRLRATRARAPPPRRSPSGADGEAAQGRDRSRAPGRTMRRLRRSRPRPRPGPLRAGLLTRPATAHPREARRPRPAPGALG